MSSPPLALQTLLRSHGFDGLTDLFIKARRHPLFPQLVCFKYDQRRSPMAEPAVQDARGLILDESEGWAVVSMSFRKFFNLGEPLAAELDWNRARVEEKLDGSLLVLYPYAGAWQVQTSGTPDAGGMTVSRVTQSGPRSFADLFWATFEELGYSLPSLDLPYSFAFELMTPDNEILVRQDQARLVLHGVRHLGTLQEEAAEDWATRLGYEGVKTVELSREGLRDAANARPATDSEGFVVRDASFARVKVKSEQYVLMSHVREHWTPERAAQVILKGEVDEFVVSFPEYGAELQQIQAKLNERLAEISEAYQTFEDAPDQKAFAAHATQTRFPAALFALRVGKAQRPLDWLLSQTEAAQGRTLQNWGVIPERWTP